MAFRFEELKVWQLALRLSNEIDLLVKPFPKEELYSLSSQMKRAADSVVLNIAEGSTGQSKPEFKRFLGIGLRSAIEVVSCLFIAQSRKYISEENFKKYYDEYEVLCKMITKLRDSM
ncbi:four helix bundle protein [Ferruginibacter lapsinanis]|uniref:four helix bundle protein n=1 Tax=Ferruginibacter lapsinanis TaxID=563172 RepID=UPI001E53F615|nr:four helix bundle protein [Ferruginibacter lapsinanis]UEG50526.1 four helix bundle protein [Ferruginibacter lapsinanis]